MRSLVCDQNDCTQRQDPDQMKGLSQRIRIGVVADDFTGASDAASYLRKGGFLTKLVIYPRMEDTDTDDCDAVVIALKSRSKEAREAVRDALDAANRLKMAGAEKLYFKYCSTFDSTPQGNIGPVGDALLEMTGEPFTVICPSLLDNGRAVRNGVLYVNGTALADSHMRVHPLNPMWDSRIPELMKPQSKYPAFVVTDEVLADSDSLYRMIEEREKDYPHFYLVPDYTLPEHGARIAALFSHLGFWTGGSELLMHLAACMREEEPALGETMREDAEKSPPEKEPSGSGRLMLCGSCSDMSRRQVENYLASGGRGIMVGPEDCSDPEKTAARLSEAFLSRPAEDILIYTSGSVGIRDPLNNDPVVSGKLEQLLARTAEKIMEECPVARVIVAGGETSGTVTQALGYFVFRVGESVSPGVPILYPQGTDVRLILKSGNFGGEDFFLSALV